MADEPPRKRARTKEDVVGKDALTGDPATWKGKSLASVEQVPLCLQGMLPHDSRPCMPPPPPQSARALGDDGAQQQLVMFARAHTHTHNRVERARRSRRRASSL